MLAAVEHEHRSKRRVLAVALALLLPLGVCVAFSVHDGARQRRRLGEELDQAFARPPRPEPPEQVPLSAQEAGRVLALFPAEVEAWLLTTAAGHHRHGGRTAAAGRAEVHLLRGMVTSGTELYPFPAGLLVLRVRLDDESRSARDEALRALREHARGEGLEVAWVQMNLRAVGRYLGVEDPYALPSEVLAIRRPLQVEADPAPPATR